MLLTTLALPLFALGYVALTLGEEVGWRGFAQTTLAPWGFWRATFAIAAFWGVWHVPLVAAYALAGEASWWEVPIIAVNLTLGGAALSVVRALTGSVWPAAFGHAVLNTVFVFAYSAPVLAGARDAVPAQLGFAAVGGVVWALALALAAPWVRRAAAVPQR
jgi:membrane protease YdiL (CAAX protease family)